MLQLATLVVLLQPSNKVLQLEPPKRQGHLRGHLAPFRSPALDQVISWDLGSFQLSLLF